MGTFLNNLFVQIPIIGILGKVSKKAIKESLVEMFLTISFSTLPIWFGSLILTIDRYFGSTLPELRSMSCFLDSYWQFLIKSLSNGELLMYTAAILGPTLYLGLSTFGKDKAEQPFPWIRPQLYISVMINLIAGVLFYMSRDKGYTGDTAFIGFSLVPYLLSLALLFAAITFEHEKRIADLPDAQREEEDAFITAYSAHRS